MTIGDCRTRVHVVIIDDVLAQIKAKQLQRPSGTKTTKIVTLLSTYKSSGSKATKTKMDFSQTFLSSNVIELGDSFGRK